MASREPVRVAVIGGGRMGRMHLRALSRTAEARAVALVEPVEALRAAAEGHGLRAYANLEALFDAGGVDAAIVAAPTDLHIELVSQLATAGLPVLCEKPCGLQADDTAQAVRAAAAAGVVLQVGYWRRFVPALADLRERLRGGALGAPLLISCWQWDAEPPGPAFRGRSGGILLDMGVHEFDQLRWLTGGEINEVVAFADAPDADSASAFARLDGTAALVSLGRMFPHGDCCWVEVMATKGYVREPFMWGDDGGRVFETALVAQAEAFAAAVRGEAQRGATGEDAVRAVEAVDRATRSLAFSGG